MPGQEDTSAEEIGETDVLAHLSHQRVEETVPSITVRTPSPSVNPIDPASLLRSPSPHAHRPSAGPSLLTQQLAARRQSSAPSPSSRLLRDQSPASVIELSPRLGNAFASTSRSPDLPVTKGRLSFSPAHSRSFTDENESDGDFDDRHSDESMIKITSDDPRAAARAAAILKQVCVTNSYGHDILTTTFISMTMNATPSSH